MQFFWEILAKSYVSVPLGSWHPLLEEILDQPLQLHLWHRIMFDSEYSVIVFREIMKRKGIWIGTFSVLSNLLDSKVKATSHAHTHTHTHTHKWGLNTQRAF